MLAPQPADACIQRLELTFQVIERERMQCVPILNASLQVKAIGFKRWQEYRLGILLTPWFMNVVLLPELQDWQVGSKQLIALPSGEYEFIVGHEIELGFYLSCSLFSPVLEFENQAAAEATAEIALLHLLKQQAVPEPAKAETRKALNPESLTRRALLQGRFLRS
ncbi:[NiFe]-hydrogenase assembly chaperone HybE [uncultured Thiothrix sp.]|jgi:[NiFe] hydrogenase assembly HybE family chaperone|uniref:[NiFe]-hydrogenase assembly chaperone HybE n=1 Tax=uncultured Thiothrix sp. TaxID=223185 RepID=UPI00260D7B08|nr:[NiFe]-hydrogenase assembly chaperone HybE [uncultured Thiothrix sp.]HMT93973.1 [NiFe]-hydrogenase assembly chaperone HybE [Thiolinea sp.]